MTNRPTIIDPVPAPEVRRVAVVCSTYNDWITKPLLEGAMSEFKRRMGSDDGLIVLYAPGSFELPVLAKHAAETGEFDAVVALGCVIKGETSHDQYINTAVSNALMQISADTGVPVGFGVLTVQDEKHAEERAGGAKGNKGVEAMAAALDAAAMIAGLYKAIDAAQPEEDA